MFNLPNYLKHVFLLFFLKQNLNKVHASHFLSCYKVLFFVAIFLYFFFLFAIYLLKNELDLDKFFTFWIWPFFVASFTNLSF